MKNYKDVEKTYIGSSDIARLTLVSPHKCDFLKYGEDGSYYAYVVDGETEIPESYELVFECKNWLWIFDDDGKQFECDASGWEQPIKVYRRGQFGTIIQVF